LFVYVYKEYKTQIFKTQEEHLIQHSASYIVFC